MKVLERICRAYVIFCVCSSDTSSSIKMRNIIISILSLITIVCVASASFTFILNYVKIDLINALNATFIFGVQAAAVYIIIAAFFLKKQITEIFSSFQQIYDTCNSILIHILDSFQMSLSSDRISFSAL